MSNVQEFPPPLNDDELRTLKAAHVVGKNFQNPAAGRSYGPCLGEQRWPCRVSRLIAMYERMAQGHKL